MASEVQESSASDGVEPQGRHGSYGFRSYAASRLQQKKPLHQKSKSVQQQQRTVKALRELKPPISLPNIHISKLREKTPKRQPQPQKCDHKMLASFDCELCKDPSAKKRLVPSLIPSSMLPRLGGNRAHQGASRWEWSQKEYRIKQTKFGIGESTGHSTIDGVCLYY